MVTYIVCVFLSIWSKQNFIFTRITGDRLSGGFSGVLYHFSRGYVAEDEVGCDEWCGRPQFCKGTSASDLKFTTENVEGILSLFFFFFLLLLLLLLLMLLMLMLMLMRLMSLMSL